MKHLQESVLAPFGEELSDVEEASTGSAFLSIWAGWGMCIPDGVFGTIEFIIRFQTNTVINSAGIWPFSFHPH